MQHIGIIGGGFLGISLALRLAESGHEVSLFESSSTLGGLSGSWQLDEITWDQFYHVILLSDSHTRELLTKAGIEEKIKWVETKTGFYINGNLYSMSNILEFLKFPPIGLLDKIRLGLTIFVASRIKNPARLEKKTAEEWLVKWSGKNNFKNIWLPLLKAKLGDHFKDASASFIWATIQRMYAARKSGIKKEMFGYVDGGYHSIIKALTDLLLEKGVRINTSHNLEQLISDDKKILKFSNGKTVECDRVVFTIPSPKIISCWKEMPESERIKHEKLTYLGVTCTSVLLKRPLSPYYVTNITDSWVPFTGIIEMTSLVNNSYFNGHSLIYLPRYLSSSSEEFARSHSDIHSEAENTLKKMFPGLRSDDIVLMKTCSAKYVFTLNTLNYSQEIPDLFSSVPGIIYGNSAQIISGTLNINETIALSEKIFQKIFTGMGCKRYTKDTANELH